MTDDRKGKPEIKITKDGPYVVRGNVPLAEDHIVIGPDGEPEKWENGASYPERESCSLCRCGRSKNKPFCDGSHLETGFDGTEAAEKRPYLEGSEKESGPGVDLTWSESLCACARFCHAGEDAWGYMERSDDPEARRRAVQEACDCPSGSLVAWDKKTGKAIEPDLAPGIGLIEIPETGMSGPIRVKGGIPIESADGVAYEVRNRVTLCRCGRSKKKPFCDGSHIEDGFQAKPGDRS